MKQYQIDDIIVAVKRLIGDGSEKGVEGFELPDYALTIDKMVKSSCEAACEEVLREAPDVLLDRAATFADAPISYEAMPQVGKDRYMAKVQLPEDFLKPVAFLMESWKGRGAEYVMPGSKDYNALRSRWHAGHGVVERPVISILPGTTHAILEAYTCANNEAVALALYAPRPLLKGTTINLFENLYLPSIYRIAAHVLATSGEAELSAFYTSESKMLCGMNPNINTTNTSEA